MKSQGKTALILVLCFFSICMANAGAKAADLPAQSGRYFQLSDRWTGLKATAQSGQATVSHAAANNNNISSHWSAEPLGDSEWFRLRNRASNGYMNIESLSGEVSVGSIGIGAWSAHWRLQRIGEFIYMTNRWLPNHAIHVEQRMGTLQHGPASTGWWSSQWRVTDVTSTPVPDVSNPSVSGRWSGVMSWPLIAIHSVLTPDGKVLTYGTDGTGAQGANFIYDVWNPALGVGNNAHATLPNTTGTDMFCSAQMVLPKSGEVLITGGDTRGLNTGVLNRGVVDTNLFNSRANTLTPNRRMNYARWYPTATALANGEILVHGGIDENGAPVPTPEIYNPDSRTWRTLPGARSNLYSTASGWWYPRSWLAPNGSLFGLTGESMYTIDPGGQGSLRVTGTVTGTNKYYTSTAVMYRPGKILQIAGGVQAALDTRENASAQVTEYDINGATPRVIPRPSLTYPRHWANSTVLPDGKVVVTGGSAASNTLKKVATAVEIYDPDTATWTVGASAAEDRLYHSTAILLPNASILTAGGGAPGPVDQNGNRTAGNLNAEIYYPPYYFNSNGTIRTLASITNAPARIKFNSTFTIASSNSADAAKISLVRTGSNTHSTDMEQRYLELGFSRNANGALQVNAPTNPNVAPPGHYLLFVVDQAGTPSTGQIINLESDSVVKPDSEYFQLTDRWIGNELYAFSNDTTVKHADIAANEQASHWSMEQLPGQPWFRLKNRLTGNYMHIESRNGTVSVGNVPAGYWSSHWRLESTGAYNRIVNRWLSSDKIHVEQLSGSASHGTISDGAWSAQWSINSI